MSQDQVPPVIIAHDYQCPWSWISLFQARRLNRDYPGMRQDWRGYELLPGDAVLTLGSRPQPAERLLDLARKEGVPFPTRMPAIVSTHDALEGAEYVKDKAPHRFDDYNEAVYHAFWGRLEDISRIETLTPIIQTIGLDPADFAKALASHDYDNKVVLFPDGAYADGITHVTTFGFRGEQCCEAPYSTVSDLAGRFFIRYGKNGG